MNQHYVPKVYLKQFESPRKKLYSLHNIAHKFSPHVKEVTKGQVGYIPDFYTIKNENTLTQLGLSDKYIIEKDFNARIENRFEKILARLLSSSQKISLQDAEEALLILLSIKQRNPIHRQVFENPVAILEAFNQKFKGVFEHQDLFEEILKREGQMNFEEFVEYGQNYAHQFAHDPDTPQYLHTQGILNLHQNEETITKEIVSRLLGCNWYIFESSTQWPFVTSDNPGFCFDNNESVHNLNFANFAEFCFPLTPKHLLIITARLTNQISSEKQIYRRLAKPDLVKLANRATFEVSYKKLLSNDENSLRHVWYDMCQFKPHLNKTPDYKSTNKRNNYTS